MIHRNSRGEVVGRERKIARVVEVRGFDARTVTSGRAVRLLRERPGKKFTSYDQAIVILFDDGVDELAVYGWGGFHVMGEQTFAVSPEAGATVIWRRELSAEAVRTLSRRTPPASATEGSGVREAPGPFSVEVQNYNAAVEEPEGAHLWSARLVTMDAAGGGVESIVVFNLRELVSPAAAAAYARALTDNAVRRVDVCEPYSTITEGREAWWLTERSTKTLDEYVAANDLGPLGPEIENEGDEPDWRVQAVLRLRLVDPRTEQPWDGVAEELERVEAQLMALEPAAGIAWEDDGEEVGDWYEWPLLAESRAVVRRFVGSLFADRTPSVRHALTFEDL